jgi:hypothetical protein
MNVEGSTSGQKVNLTVSDDELAAGLVLGASVALNFDVSTQYYSCWVSKWNWWGPSISCGWKTGLDVSPSLSLDLLKLAYEALKLALGKESALKPANKPEEKESVVSSPISVQSYGVSDFQSGTFADENGALKASPVFSVPINLWSVICNSNPGAKAFNETLKAARISIGFGPSFGLTFPVRVNMHEIYLDNVKYGSLTVSGSTVTGTTTETPPSGASVGNINVKFSESPGIDFYIGVFASISAFEVFSLAYETGWGLLELIGVKPALGPYYFDMASTAGKMLAQACDTCGVNSGLYEVIFE